MKISRRSLVFAAPSILAAQAKPPTKKSKPLPGGGEFTRIIDPVTENAIVRLTAPTSSSLLPDPHNRYVSSRERTLIFSSDRSGSFAPYQLDLRSGLVKQLTETGKLNPRSLSFDHQEKAIRYLDGESLFEVGLTRGSPRLVADGVSWYSGAADGSLYLITGGKLTRRQGQTARILAESAIAAWPQPTAAGCIFSRTTGPDEAELHYVTAEGSSKPALLAAGRVRQPFWEAEGQSILFLRDVTAANGTLLAEIHGQSISGAAEYSVCRTSQFATFSPNRDASVFVGASRSRAQPNVVLMLRTPCREMTLCEHHASHPGDVSPVFSPDNRRIYFESDHEGRPAIYSVNVELLVEHE